MPRVAELRLHLPQEDRGELADGGRPLPHRLGVLDGEVGHLLQERVALLARVGKDLDVVRSDVPQVRRDLVLHPLHERDDRDDRRDADHDAENRQDASASCSPQWPASAIFRFSENTRID